jgi:hypothetical protein
MFSDIGDVSSIQRDGRPPTVATAGAAVVHPARAPDDAEASPREGGGDVRLEANVTSCEGRDFSRFRDFSRPCAEENFPSRSGGLLPQDASHSGRRRWPSGR